MNTSDSKQSALVQRLVKMGLSTAANAFPPDGVPLIKLVPWWRLWARSPRRFRWDNHCASVFPAVSSGLITLNPENIVQGIFAAMLPLHEPKTSVLQWSQWIIASILDNSYSGQVSMLGVLEHLLQNRPEEEKIEAWSQIINCSFDKTGKGRYSQGDQSIALLEAVGRTGLRALAPLILNVLQNGDEELMLSAMACLARLRVPDAEMPAEVLLNRICPQLMNHARCAVAFIESRNVDLLAELLKNEWCERMQVLRLVEALLDRS
jgi:hypothetical protein